MHDDRHVVDRRPEEAGPVRETPDLDRRVGAIDDGEESAIRRESGLSDFATVPLDQFDRPVRPVV